MKGVKRKIAAILIVVATVVTSLNIPALKNVVLAGMTEDGLYYTVDDSDDTVTITGYKGDALYVNIPQKIEGKEVTSIEVDAFKNCSILRTITIPNSVTSIGNCAFWKCVNLYRVTISNSVTSIEDSAFSGCSRLESITIPDSVKSIGNNAFYGCSGLESITISDSVTNIGNGAFYGCSGLKSISIPDSVKSIGDFAFYGCSGLESITISDSVKSIGDNAFRNCSSLKSITIPDGVTNIGDRAFYDCTSLESIKVDGSNPVYDSRNECNAIIETASNTLIAGCKNTIIPDSVKSIGDYAFSDCSGLESITIPNSVTSIGDAAFYGCSSLTSITIPNSVTSIVDFAFYGCSSLESITIPDSVTSIGTCAFDGCSSLESITIPDSVTSIGDYAFRDCSGLKSMTIPNSVTSIVDNAFFDCNKLTIYVDYETRVKEVKKLVGINNVIFNPEVFHAHIGGTATCTQKAVCEICGEYGELAAHDYSDAWTSDGTSHWHKCKNCDAVTAKAAHTYVTASVTKATLTANGKLNKKCSVCGKTTSTAIYKPTTFTLAKTSYAYTGSQIKPTVTVKDSAGKTISSAYYTLTYGTNKSIGKGSVKVTFKGNYLGTKTLTFKIVPKATPITSIANTATGITLKWSRNTTATGYAIYRSINGGAYSRVATITANTTVAYTDKTATSNGKKYTYKIYPYKTVSKVNYYNTVASAKTTYRLLTPTVSAGNNATRRITVKWNRNAYATGYKVRLFAGSTYKDYVVKGNTNITKVFTSLVKNKTYKIYVTSYKTVSGVNYYSGWSAAKTVKVTR